MSGDIIKSFLVGLGFEVDDQSLAVFNKGIENAAKKITGLYAAVTAFTGGIVFAFSKISEGFEEMGREYHIIAPAINKALILRRELLKAYGAAGINIRKTIVDSINLNLSLTKTKFALEAIYKSVGSKFFGLLQRQSDSFRKRLYENMPFIQNALETLVKGVFKAFDIAVQFGERLWNILTRVYGFFVDLDRVTNGWSTTILALVAAWKFLNLEFLASPIGIIFALGAALVVLYDDFKTFKEGGQAFLDWNSDAVKAFTGLGVVIAGVAAAWFLWNRALIVYEALAPVVTAVTWAFNAAMAASPIGLVVIAVGALIAGLTILALKWDTVKKGFVDFFSGVGGKFLDFVAGAPNLTASVNNLTAPAQLATPLGSNVSNNASQTNNVTLNQSVNSTGVTDASKVGSRVTDANAGLIGAFQRSIGGFK